MTLAHLNAAKPAIAIAAGIATAIVAFVTDPTIKVAIITGLSIVMAAMIGQAVTLILGIMSYKLQKQELAVGQRVEKNTDGFLAIEKAKADKSAADLVDTKGQLDHARGRREGSEAERDMEK